METPKPLFWHQGLFLQPQHFQMADLAWDASLTPFRQWLSPHFWGVQELDIKKAALGIRSFGVVKGRFLFPDGTHVEYPGNAVLEDRSFEEAWIEGGKPFSVYIGVRKWNSEDENVTVVKKGELLSDVATRFIAPSDPEETKDLHAGGPTGHVKKLTYLLKIFWETEKDHLGDYALIPLAQVERQGESISLRGQFIPPCLAVASSDPLAKLTKDIEHLLASRSRQLEEHKSQRGIHAAEFGSRDMVYLLALQSLNRSLPWLRHYAEAPQVHPWQLYGLYRQIIGDLSCFSERINVLGEDSEHDNQALPPYNHQSLWECFSASRELIVRLLNEITAGPDYVVALQLADGLFSADLKPALFDGKTRFYLALTTAEDAKTFLQSIDSLSKLSSKTHVNVLMSHALPGIALNFLTLPPQELPRRKNVFYFAIDQHNEQWSSIERERALAFAWDGPTDDLKVELMAVTQ